MDFKLFFMQFNEIHRIKVELWLLFVSFSWETTYYLASRQCVLELACFDYYAIWKAWENLLFMAYNCIATGILDS